MEEMYKILLASIAATKIPATIETFAENYFANILINNAVLLTNDPYSWNEIQFTFPIIVRPLNSNVTDNLDTTAFLLDLRTANGTTTAYRPPNWKINAKMVVVVDEWKEEDTRQIFEQLGNCHVLLLSIGENEDIKPMTFNNPCRGIVNEIVTQPLNEKCAFNASFLDLPPNVVHDGSKIHGFEGMMMRTAAEHLGFQMEFINEHETGYGKFDPPSGLLGNVATGVSIGGFGALYPFRNRWQNAEMIFGCQITTIAWGAPVGAGPAEPTWSIILVSELSPTVWIMTFAIFAGLIPVSIMFDSSVRDDLLRPFHILALFLGVSQRFLFMKSLTIVIIFFGFILSTCYQAMMSSKLTVPHKVADITTLKELANSGLTLTGPPTHGNVMADVAAAAPDDKAKQKIHDSYVVSQAPLDEVLPRMVTRRDFAFLRHGYNLYYFAQQSPTTNGKIHIVEEPVATFIPVLLLTKHSCHAPKFQDIYLRLCHSGLGGKWLRDYTAIKKIEGEAGPVTLNLGHIRGFLFLVLVGWTFSMVAFFLELVMFYGVSSVGERKVRFVNADDTRNYHRHHSYRH